MNEMDSSLEEVGPTEGTILALLDFLVDPLLPSRSSSSYREIVSPSQEELVAKQVHAVVLLYNYYHRKRHPELDFLEFASFCRMAAVLKPSLLAYMKFMQRADNPEVDDLDKPLSLTEKAIMNSCNICKSLDASISSPVIEGWPISKIAVFLVDSRKENCFLFHSSITQGVWSVIEKDVDDPNQSLEAVTETRPGNKKKKATKRTTKENHTADEASLQQLAYLAVKEACGINQSDLRTLENHMVYSIGKEKTVVRLYIMQCTQTNHDMNLVPVNDAMQSLHGPLVIKESGSWITTAVVEYFHLLPFAEKVLDWLSREGLINILQPFEAVNDDDNCNSSHLKVEALPNTPQFFEPVMEVEDDKSSHLEEEPLPITSHPFDTVKDVEKFNCSQSEVEPLPITSHHFETVKEVEEFGSSHLEVEALSNISHHCEPVKEVEKNNSPHSEVEALSTTSHHCKAVKEVEKNNSSPPKVETLPNDSHNFETVKEVEKCNSSHSEVEPMLKTSHHCEAVKEVGIYVKEEQSFDTSQLGGPKEVRNGGSYDLKEEPLQYMSEQCEAEKEVEDNNSSHRKREHTETKVYKKRNKSKNNYTSSKKPCCKISNGTTDYPRQEDELCTATGSSNNMDIDESVMTCSQVDGRNKILLCNNHVENQKEIILAQETDQTAFTGGALIVVEDIDNLPSSRNLNNEKVFSENKISDTAMSDQDEKQDHALVSFDSNIENLHKIQLTIASKEPLLSQTALKVLFRKREILSHQLRHIADDIALCDRNIQTILSGGEDDLAVKLETIIEGCNDTCLRSVTAAEDRTSPHFVDQELPPVLKSKRLSEANLSVHNPCQDLELDGICNENSWTLPTYNVSVAEGGFQARVNVKGVDFECSCEGAISATPREARYSAASNILVKLRSLATES